MKFVAVLGLVQRTAEGFQTPLSLFGSEIK
jgi:hypothetical protein